MKESGRVGTITDGYKNRVWAFIQSIDSNNKKDFKAQYFTAFLKGINGYFQTYTIFEALSMSDCVDKVVHEFVPIDFYDQLNKDKKRDVLYNVLISCLKEFARKIISEHCGLLIDEHDDVSNIDTLRELAVDLLIIERHKMYQKFLTTVPKKSKNATVDTIDENIVRDLRAELHALYKQRDVWERDRRDMEKKVAELVAQVDEKQKIALDLLDKYRAARDHLARLKDVVQRPSATQRPSAGVTPTSATPFEHPLLASHRSPAVFDPVDAFQPQHRPLSEILGGRRADERRDNERRDNERQQFNDRQPHDDDDQDDDDQDDDDLDDEPSIVAKAPVAKPVAKPKAKPSGKPVGRPPAQATTPMSPSTAVSPAIPPPAPQSAPIVIQPTVAPQVTMQSAAVPPAIKPAIIAPLMDDLPGAQNLLTDYI